MTFGEKLKYAAFGCFCTLVGVLLSSSVLPLFGRSGENAFYDTVFCKALTVYGEDSQPIAILGNSRTLRGENEEYGTLLLSPQNKDLHEYSALTNSGLSFYTDKEDIAQLGVVDNTGKLMLKDSNNDGRVAIANSEGEFGLVMFGPKGMGIDGGAALMIQKNKGQLTLFGENEEILFGRGGLTYGE